MTIKELTINMWYAQNIKVLREKDGVIFYDFNWRLRSESCKYLLNKDVISFGADNSDIVIKINN